MKKTRSTRKTEAARRMMGTISTNVEAVKAAVVEKTVEAGKSIENIKAEHHAKRPEWNMVLQYEGREYSVESIQQLVTDVWVNQMQKSEQELKKTDVYIKPEEQAVYFVVNGEVTGKAQL